ncbi:hypothetical protein [Nitrosophilus kaiyonis]|uniref:hypothetical protein n=1 Tax=Nitrosophilus kaiyonis TaxID=2930200 RepID=UPI002490F111|nr:hypothetical protein [Nitrosophilus kaiyonis]
MDYINNDWKDIIEKSYRKLDVDYRYFLEKDSSYFPDFNNMFNAFKTLPLENTKYILFGQDPYPRYESAIGYAFIDAKVKKIFDEKNGLSKEVNRAVSLRNFIKMALKAQGYLIDDTSKEAIKKIDKSGLINTIFELKSNFEKNGVLLLNRALIFTKKEDSKKHLKMWKPFIESLLNQIKDYEIDIILFGNAAKEIENLDVSKYFKLYKFEHPYNVSFVENRSAHKFFGPMKLLSKNHL